MQFGIWTPLPHTIRPERMGRTVAEIKSPRSTLGGREDGTFAFACEAVRRADELGFDTTLIAERFLGTDLSAWVNALGAGPAATPEVIAQRLLRYEKSGLDCATLRFAPMPEGVEMVSMWQVLDRALTRGLFGSVRRLETAVNYKASSRPQMLN
jgi:alkanesulfonate monooxygenase SsuD/methylene tetrahydromethanopterin reductase-like flavin-dependent oxidoreductase (luciferase family)